MITGYFLLAHSSSPTAATSGSADMDPRGSRHLSLTKEDAATQLARSVARLANLQEQLYADNRWGVLLIFQAMDAAGKDSVIKHVLSGVNPQGCQVASLQSPSAEELNHDFLWRTTSELPERGRIGVFNRSYYEEVLIVRVHPELLADRETAGSLITPESGRNGSKTSARSNAISRAAGS